MRADADLPFREVYRTPSRRDCNERALVLQVAGIPHRLIRDGGISIIVVDSGHADRAAAELAAYERENRGWPPPEPPVWTSSRGWAGVLAYGLVISCVSFLDSSHALGGDWRMLGRMNAGLVMDGAWWRTVTALTLHLDVEHLIANLIFGTLFGLFAGQLLGSGLAWAAIFLAGALGNAMNAALQPPAHNAIGASTSVFGALGILAAHAWMRRNWLAFSRFRRWTPVVGGGVLLAYTGLGGERTDFVAHLTGFAAGLGFGALCSAFGRRVDMQRKTQAALGIATCVAIAACWLIAWQDPN